MRKKYFATTKAKGGKALVDFVMTDFDEEEEVGVDGELILQYSKRVAKYIPYSQVGEYNIGAIRRVLFSLKKDIYDGFANGLAIGTGNNVFVIDSGMEEGHLSFGVRNVIAIRDNNLRQEYVRSNNNDGLSKGYFSDEISSRIRNELYNDRQYTGRQELREELSTNNGESDHNEGRISEGDGNRGVRGLGSNNNVKFSSRSLDKYTLEEYNNYGWVRSNDILSAAEWVDFNGKFAKAVRHGDSAYPPFNNDGIVFVKERNLCE